jgi:hypothetical protein
MKSNDLRKRLQKERPMNSATLRMPQDVVDDLKRVAPLLGFSGYQPLIRAYVGEGLRHDLERLEGRPEIGRMIESLRRHGVAERVIKSAVEQLQEPPKTRAALKQAGGKRR